MDDDVDKQLEAEFNQWKEETAEKERLLTENKLSDKEVMYMCTIWASLLISFSLYILQHLLARITCM